MLDSSYADFDYNLLYTTDTSRFVKLGGSSWGGTYTSFSTYKSALNKDINSISVSNPGFVDAANGDYRLQSNSPCIDKGVVIPGINALGDPWEYKGSGPDIGALESNVTANPILSIAVSGQGTTNPAPGSYQYSSGSVVSIQAIPSSGWRFDHWDGPVFDPSSASTTVTVNQNTVVTAVFVQIVMVTLTITVSGQGTTEPAVGQHSYAQGSQVTINAFPASGWVFSEWREGSVALSHSAQITLDLTSSRSVMAVFSQVVTPPKQHSLIITAVGGGTTDPAPGTYIYDEDAVITVTAIPGSGFYFVEWIDGANHYLVNPISVVMSSDKSLVAVFQPIVVPPKQYTLTISCGFGGHVIPAAGSYTYSEGSTVQVVAIPDPGYEFTEWQENGQTLSTEQSITLMITSDRNIRAIFAELPTPPENFLLGISVLGYGTTDPPPGAYSLPQNSPVTIRAIPQEGNEFNHWDGDISGNQSVVSFILDKDMTVTAVFSASPVKKEMDFGTVLLGTVVITGIITAIGATLRR